MSQVGVKTKNISARSARSIVLYPTQTGYAARDSNG